VSARVSSFYSGGVERERAGTSHFYLVADPFHALCPHGRSVGVILYAPAYHRSRSVGRCSRALGSPTTEVGRSVGVPARSARRYTRLQEPLHDTVYSRYTPSHDMAGASAAASSTMDASVAPQYL
jgi:hypothetical protein